MPEYELALLVDRCLRRYDTLMSAHSAEVALGITRAGNLIAALGPRYSLRLAFKEHIEQATQVGPGGEVRRAHNYSHAAAVGEFVRHVGLSAAEWVGDECGTVDPNPPNLFRRSLELLGHFDTLDLYDATHVRSLGDRAQYYWAYVRSCRVLHVADAHWSDALFCLDEERFFSGSGCEHHRLNLEYERIAILIQAALDPQGGNAAMTRRIGSLGRYIAGGHAYELDRIFHSSWWRGRLWVALLLARYLIGDLDTEQLFARLAQDCYDRLRSETSESAHWMIHDFNLNLCLVDVGDRRGISDESLIVYANAAYRIAETLCVRWRIVTRIHSPLALAMRQCLGDLAEVCARRSGLFDELGFKVALLVKRTGLSRLMQAASIELPEHIRSCLKDVATIDESLWQGALLDALGNDLREQRKRTRDQMRDRLHNLAIDYLDPAVVEIEQVREQLRGRPALDYTLLESTGCDAGTAWYRTAVDTDGTILFDRQPDFADGTSLVPDLNSPKSLQRAAEVLLGREAGKIASRYLSRTRTKDPDNIPDLIISVDGALSTVPWGLLPVGTPSQPCASVPLLEAACLAMTPTLASLTGRSQLPVTGKALVHLVPGRIIRAENEPLPALDVDIEAKAWGLDPEDAAHERPARSAICCLDMTAKSQTIFRRLPEMLANRSTSLGFLHVAAHGDGSGFDQILYLPEPLTAANSFVLHWPSDVLLATCHLGGISPSEDSEPMGFCISALVGGATCVVSAVGEVLNKDAGAIAEAIVTTLRQSGSQTLPRLLRAAQLDLMNTGEPRVKAGWHNMVAHIR